MKQFWAFAALFVAHATAASISVHSKEGTAGKVRYDNYSVHKLILRNGVQARTANLLKYLSTQYDIWKNYDEVSREVHIMLSPDSVHDFNHIVRMNNFDAEIMIPNVQTLIDSEELRNAAQPNERSVFGWTSYYGLQEIETWLDHVLATYPNVTEGFSIGKSYEGREIRGIKISYRENNPGIFIESNIHAREWITSATATWLIDQLLTSDSEDVRNIAENYDWYIIPVFNVDGFVYSHETDRMWRKTRQPASNSACMGADANRNFDSHWLENGGASDNPCSNTFAGAEPFSEPEVAALSDYLMRIKDKLHIYLSFHSYGQYLLSPYGHSSEEFPPNYEDLLTIGGAFATAIGSLPYNTTYTYGSSASVLYVASGTSVDWVYNELGINLAYTIEYRDKGRYGFVLPAIQILPNCEELMAGMLALIETSQSLGYV